MTGLALTWWQSWLASDRPWAGRPWAGRQAVVVVCVYVASYVVLDRSRPPCRDLNASNLPRGECPIP
jgi:hypothetical protein